MRRAFFSLTLILVVALVLVAPAFAELAVYRPRREQLSNPAKETQVNLSATVAAQKGELQMEVQNRREQLQNKKETLQTKVKEKKQQIFDKIKKQTLIHIDRLITHLQTIQSKIEATPQLEDSEKQNAITNTKNLISRLNQFKDQVESAQSLEDLRGIRQNLRSVWQEIRLHRKKLVGQIMVGRFRRFITRMEKAATRLDNHLGALSEKGVDVTSAQKALADFKNALTSAQTKTQQAQTLFENGNLEQGKKLMREAKQELHTAGLDLRTAIKSLRSQIENEQK